MLLIFHVRGTFNYVIACCLLRFETERPCQEVPTSVLGTDVSRVFHHFFQANVESVEQSKNKVVSVLN